MNTKPNDQLREQLKQAIANVRHQIEIQGMSDHYIGSGAITAEAIGELRSELTQLEQALADLK
jgi:16S rRNA G966 N2-methylase RsmD